MTPRIATASLMLVILVLPGKLAHGRHAAGASPLREISAGGYSACAVRQNGTITCWGIGTSGQTRAPHVRFRYVSVGDTFACGIVYSRRVRCWGEFAGRPSSRYRFAKISSGSIY